MKRNSEIEVGHQDIFIRSRKIENGNLVVENELGDKYLVDLKNKVKKRSQPLK